MKNPSARPRPSQARRILGVFLVAGALALRSAPARAETHDEPLYTPSIFIYGWNGIALGAGAGLGAGYLAARAGGWESDDWRALVYGAGFGGLAGGALGLTLGITDMANETQGRGHLILRDGGYGLGFGVATGAIIGGLTAASSKEPEQILLGGAIGGLAGTAVGLVLGIVEGQRAWRRHTKVALTLAPAPEASGKLVWMPALIGRY
jgi:hypothetical protein